MMIVPAASLLTGGLADGFTAVGGIAAGGATLTSAAAAVVVSLIGRSRSVVLELAAFRAIGGGMLAVFAVLIANLLTEAF